MARTFSRRLLLLLAALVALAVYRVDSAPGPTAPYGGYTWQGVIDQARFEIEATVTGVRREILEAEAAYTRMWHDVQQLHTALRNGTP